MNTFERIDLQLFAHADPFVPGTTPGTPNVNPVNVSTQSSMEPTIKTFYDTTLLENYREENIFGQFAQKTEIKGSKAEWRKFNKFDKAIAPLKEGVIPSGQDFGMTKLEVSTTQHGSYTAVSDVLEMDAYDDIIFGATEEMGASAGETKDYLTRNVLDETMSVYYAPIVSSDGAVTEVKAENSITADAKVTPEVIARVATDLRKAKAPRIDGSYVALIHPSTAHDIRQSSDFKEFHKYAATTEIFNGEIGELHGVRFVLSTACKVSKTGASGAAVYNTYVIGKDAYGEVTPEGGDMEMIIKGKEYGGPLNQYSTIGYKFRHAAKVLYPERIIIIKSGSSYSAIDEAN